MSVAIEWRASRIHDPIERLRYLSHVTGGRRIRLADRVRAMVLLTLPVLAPLPMISDSQPRHVARPPRVVLAAPPETTTPAVWLVEKSSEHDIYSNGLRIENRYAVANQPRSYRAFDRRQPGMREVAPKIEPAGILFHSTESEQAPFEAAHNRSLKRLGESLLVYVRNQRAYHFVIDRFGRVHRIVMESDSAHHAGNSVWADATSIYLNLNDSFLGVAIEAQSDGASSTVWINDAQVHAARILTEVLRARYTIAAENCVTHAQVSVNPDNMQAGYHTDFGGSFPFLKVGLPDNYGYPLPGIRIFGFTFAPAFLQATGGSMRRSVLLADEQVREDALARGVSVRTYRRSLQQKYRNLVTIAKSSLKEEKQHE